MTREQQELFRQALLGVDRHTIIQTSHALLQQMLSSQTSQVIMGAQTNHLEGFVSRGWQLQQFVDDLSLNSESYIPNQEHSLSQILSLDTCLSS